MQSVRGIHHITAIASDPQLTVDFYVGLLGLRLVKKSINQDVPDTYHLFFADGAGNPGTDLTFFPWAQLPAGRPGSGMWGEVSFVIPPHSMDYWQERLTHAQVPTGPPTERFGEPVLTFTDPAGMELALVGTDIAPDQPSAAWDASPVPAEHQIRALGSVRLTLREAERTTRFLSEAFGFQSAGTEDGWQRLIVGTGKGGQRLDLREDPDARRGSQGTGSVHHVAFAVPDDPAEAAVRQQVIAAGGRPTDFIDRFWFHSVYVQEPSGALCEVATDIPGFAVDEDPRHLGESLVLPPWYEEQRAAIERVLPPITVPTGH